MAKIGIFVGSSGGVTLGAAQMLEELLEGSELVNMEDDFEGLDQFDDFDVLLIGSSTWGQGDPQRDWVDPLYEMQNDAPDLSGKKVALFGAGDQKTHGEHFVSALAKMEDVFKECGASVGFGYISKEGYEYEFSLAEKEGKLCGLAIDAINQADATQERVANWAAQLKQEMGL